MSLLPNLPSRRELKEEAARLLPTRDALHNEAEERGHIGVFLYNGVETAMIANRFITPSQLLDEVIKHVERWGPSVDQEMRGYINACLPSVVLDVLDNEKVEKLAWV